MSPSTDAGGTVTEGALYRRRVDRAAHRDAEPARYCADGRFSDWSQRDGD